MKRKEACDAVLREKAFVEQVSTGVRIVGGSIKFSIVFCGILGLLQMQFLHYKTLEIIKQKLVLNSESFSHELVLEIIAIECRLQTVDFV